jgi:ribosomal protein S18 acetylase RimI-like enzyme
VATVERQPGQAVEILDLRHFSSADLRSLLEEECGAWERLLAWDYRGSAEMILRYLDARILPGYAATAGGRVAGYSFFVYEGGKGVIGDLFVSAGPGGVEETRALEQRLLSHVIETLQLSPGVNRVEAQLLVHESGAVAEPFLREGFRRRRRMVLMLPLASLAPGGRALPAEVALQRWSEADYQGAAALITAAYRGHVDAEINDQYRSVSGSLRFLNNIVRFPGCGVFDAESSLVALHRATRRPAGLILCSRVKDDVAHVTQLCVSPELTRRGLGEALLRAAAHNLAQRGFRALSLTVTEANRPAVGLYSRLGFQVHHVFDAFVWEG